MFTEKRVNDTNLDSCYPCLGAVVSIQTIIELNAGNLTPKNELREIVSRVSFGFDIDGSLKTDILRDTESIERNLEDHFHINAHFEIPFMSLDDIKKQLHIS